MIELIVDNSMSQVKGLNTEQYSALRNVLSYEPDSNAAFFGGFKAQSKRYLIDKRGMFPTGLVHRVVDHLKRSKTPYITSDVRTRPHPTPRMFKMNLGAIVPYQEQSAAAVEAVLQEVGGIVMPTGSGKSITMALLVNAMQVKTLIVVPNLELKRQLSETFISIFGSLRNITIENIDSPKLDTLTDFDMILLDECHKSAAATYQRLNRNQWRGIYHRFYFTATFFRNQESEQLLFEAICGKIIYKLPHAKAVARGLIVPVEAYYLELPTQDTDAFTYAQVYKELVVNNTARNALIADVALSLQMGGIHVLTLVKEIAHGKLLHELTGMPFANGQDEDSRRYLTDFKTNKIKALIATEGVAGEGADFKSCEYVIIAGLGKAKSGLMQKIGRVLRVYPGKESGKVILFKDKSHRFTLRHFNEQKRVLLDEYGVVPVKLTL